MESAPTVPLDSPPLSHDDLPPPVPEANGWELPSSIGGDQELTSVDDRAFGVASPVYDCQTPINGSTATTTANTNGGESKPMQVHLAEEDVDCSNRCKFRQRMIQALRHLKELIHEHVLIQVWAPRKDGRRIVLTTSGQPFVLDAASVRLLQFRTVSLSYMFSLDGDNDDDLGLPCRVFRQEMPEWTPNVQYYSSKEYPRLFHALNYDLHGTLALPVFDPFTQICVGVVELVMTSQMINYSGLVDKVCKALKAANLNSVEITKTPSIEISNEGCQVAMAEILQILIQICETHELPLAQTWLPCKIRATKNCFSFGINCRGDVCMSISGIAFHVADAHMWGFREACIEHHLQKGQGVAGMTFASHKPNFSENITEFSKKEYPLVHYARLFGLHSCFAVCLQSDHSGTDEYILEFFLPSNCKDSDKQQALVKSMIAQLRSSLSGVRLSSDVQLQLESTI